MHSVFNNPTPFAKLAKILLTDDSNKINQYDDGAGNGLEVVVEHLGYGPNHSIYAIVSYYFTHSEHYSFYIEYMFEGKLRKPHPETYRKLCIPRLSSKYYDFDETKYCQRSNLPDHTNNIDYEAILANILLRLD